MAGYNPCEKSAFIAEFSLLVSLFRGWRRNPQRDEGVKMEQIVSLISVIPASWWNPVQQISFRMRVRLGRPSPATRKVKP
jgi:hypothetical protein